MPRRVIAKKRCRAMFEPPEKGEPTPHPNLSTRLNLLFSDQALGRRVDYCWSRRASVRRLIFSLRRVMSVVSPIAAKSAPAAKVRADPRLGAKRQIQSTGYPPLTA